MARMKFVQFFKREHAIKCVTSHPNDIEFDRVLPYLGAKRLRVYHGVFDSGKQRQITLAARKPASDEGNFIGLIGELIGTYPADEALEVALAHARML